VVDLGRDSIGCVLLDDVAQVAAGTLARGIGDVLRVP